MSDDLMNNEPERANEDTIYDGDTADIEELGSNSVYEVGEGRRHGRRRRNDGRAPGFGGWLAAVISLSAVCLALAAVVTYGWLNISSMQEAMAGMQTEALYELNSIVDNLDSNLSKARVASSPRDRTQLLSDIAIESEMAEVILERMPLETQFTGELTAFLNKMGDSAQSMLHTAAAGGDWEEWQLSGLEYMYRNNLKIKKALNDIVSSSTPDDMLALVRGKESIFAGGMQELENNVIEEPKGIFDGPFAEGAEKTNISYFETLPQSSAADAVREAEKLFADYGVTGAKCTGEAAHGGTAFYNVALTTGDGEMLAQLSKRGAKLVMFDSYKPCDGHNFSPERCRAIAEDFLAAAGYEGLTPVWMSENGTTCNINFCAEQNGVVLYPDMIKVKVCEERGIVTGMEAMSYVKNHSSRHIAGATVTSEQAESAIDGRIEVRGTRLALIPLDGEELLCHEFNGTFDGREYFVYVDARTGEEVQVLTVIGTAQGRAVL